MLNIISHTGMYDFRNLSSHPNTAQPCVLQHFLLGETQHTHRHTPSLKAGSLLVRRKYNLWMQSRWRNCKLRPIYKHLYVYRPPLCFTNDLSDRSITRVKQFYSPAFQHRAAIQVLHGCCSLTSIVRPERKKHIYCFHLSQLFRFETQLWIPVLHIPATVSVFLSVREEGLRAVRLRWILLSTCYFTFLTQLKQVL